jgi:N-methylhydantoinase B/oxoprolinase/acetone carboxylase alpha subunit
VAGDNACMQHQWSACSWPWGSGGGKFRGDLGREKHIRILEVARFVSVAGRSILACWGARAGKGGMRFQEATWLTSTTW